MKRHHRNILIDLVLLICPFMVSFIGIAIDAEWWGAFFGYDKAFIVVLAFSLLLLIGGLLRIYFLLTDLEVLRRKVIALLKSDEKLDLNLASSFQTFQNWLEMLHDLSEYLQNKAADKQQYLVSVLESIRDCVLVINQDGLITMYNAEATTQLGSQQLRIGHTIFGIFKHAELAEVLAELKHKPRQKVKLTTLEGDKIKAFIGCLANHQGYVICFDSIKQEIAPNTSNSIMDELLLKPFSGSGITEDVTLHAALDTVPEISSQTRIEDLLALVIDCEATGLDVRKEAIISLGGVYCKGNEIHRNRIIEELIQPHQSVTPESYRIHGISNEILANSATLEVVWQQLEKPMQTPIIVGHQIGFDIALIRNNLKHYGIDWQPKFLLDTMALAYNLIPSLRQKGLHLEVVTNFLGIKSVGRHTALGDAILTAKIYTSLLHLALDEGDYCLHDLLTRQSRATAILQNYKQADWYPLVY